MENYETMYYGCIQAYHGHDYVFLYTKEQAEEDFKKCDIDLNLLPKVGETAYVDVFWPMGGSNSSATYIEALESKESALGFLTQSAYGPDYDDPTAVDIAEYIWSIETKEGVAQEILDWYGKEAKDYVQFDERARKICAILGIQFNNLYDDEYRDMRWSEIADKAEALKKSTWNGEDICVSYCDVTLLISEGTGDNLLTEDRDEGYVDYFNLVLYKNEDLPSLDDLYTAFESGGGFMMRDKLISEEFYGKTVEEVIKAVFEANSENDAFELHTFSIPDYLVLRVGD